RDNDAPGGIAREYVTKLSSSVGMKLRGVFIRNITPITVMAAKPKNASFFLANKILIVLTYLSVKRSNATLKAWKNRPLYCSNLFLGWTTSFVSSPSCLTGLSKSAQSAGLN